MYTSLHRRWILEDEVTGTLFKQKLDRSLEATTHKWILSKMSSEI